MIQAVENAHGQSFGEPQVFILRAHNICKQGVTGSIPVAPDLLPDRE
jgi:hypothetical protein